MIATAPGGDAMTTRYFGGGECGSRDFNAQEERLARTMMQYDRNVGAFVVPGGQSQAKLERCTQLNRALTEARTCLKHKLLNGRCAHGLLIELATATAARLPNVQAVYHEIGKLEGTDALPGNTKGPSKMRPPLRGLWHKHYFHPGFMAHNLANELDRMAKDGRGETIFSPHYGKDLGEVADQILHQIIIGGYEQRARDRKITGEFIVYEKLKDGSNYYLTLGVHGDWDEIRARVDFYRQFDSGSASP